MNRNPPLHVIEELRKEVGFICPVNGCNSPYLTWHHFDPPWNIVNHHNLDGMIALCIKHHKQADNGAFLNEQLIEMKNINKHNVRILEGKFEWLRNELLIVIGGNIFINSKIAIQHKSEKVIWFTRDHNNNILLNIHMLTDDKVLKTEMIENVWYEYGNAKDIICPPSGKSLFIEYSDGDRIGLEYKVIKDSKSLLGKYEIEFDFSTFAFPITAVEISLVQKEYGINISPKYLEIGKGNHFNHCVIQNREIAILLNDEDGSIKNSANIIMNREKT